MGGWAEFTQTFQRHMANPSIDSSHALTVYQIGDDVDPPTPEVEGGDYGELGCTADFVDGSTRVREGERKGASERELTSRRQGGVNLIATAAYTRNDPETEEERGWCDMELDHSVTRWKILRQPQTDDVGGICMLSEEVQIYSLTRKPSTAHSVLEFRLCQWDRSKRKAGSCPRR